MILDVKTLEVYYNKVKVGTLKEIEEGKSAFQYDKEWIKSGFSISPLSLPLSDKVYITCKDELNSLFGVFYDSLPNGWGELITRRALMKKGISYDSLSPLTKLALLSPFSLGGLDYRPCLYEKINSNEKSSLDSLYKDINSLYNDENINSIDLDRLYINGGSSGGARPKVHLKISGKEYIIKFPTSLDGLDAGLKEYKANEIASRCGINVNEFTLFPSRVCAGYFGALRFDRVGQKRRHVISLSGLLETSYKIPSLDYIHLARVIKLVCTDISANLKEAYRRMVFNSLYPNKDDHGKNFSFLYSEEKGGYILSPMYDINKTKYILEHEMTVNGKGNPTPSDLVDIAKEFNLNKKEAKEIIEEITSILNE
ncbi:MAG: type II toxin-antitoxin system HipA family toxin [Coprobacillus sp.]|nr:type II toxin-antitoxin system HipA family toxin [Coprobacillus sp.]